MRKVLVIDTSILCVWLEVPGKTTCGPNRDKWDKQRVDTTLKTEIEQGGTLVLPLATIIETGNHIAQAPGQRYERSLQLAEIIKMSADEKTPWAAFTDQSVLWNAEGLNTLAAEWPNLAVQGFSIGDATIK